VYVCLDLNSRATSPHVSGAPLADSCTAEKQ
jgi:hypothetical protein